MPSATFKQRLLAAVRAGAGGGSPYPSADLFAFSDNFASGSTYVRDRTGWDYETADTRGQQNGSVTAGVANFADGYFTNGRWTQNIGRNDGGSVTVTFAAAANGWNISLNSIAEKTHILVTIDPGFTRLRIARVVAASSTSMYDSGVISAFAAVGDTFTAQYAWSGSNCTVTVFKNGVQYPNGATTWTTAASATFQPTGKVGLGGSYGAYSSWSSAALGATAKPRCALNKVHRVYQRNKVDSSGTVPISGVAKGCTALQFRLLQGGAVVSGWDWGLHSIGSFVVDGSTGIFSGSISGIPQGNGYQIEIRDTVDNQAYSISRAFDIGAIWILWGQSLAIQAPYSTGRTVAAQANAWFPRSYAPPANDQNFNSFNREVEWDWDGSVTGGTTYTANISQAALAAVIRAQTTLSVGFICGGYGSQLMANFLSSSAGTPYTAGPARTLWQNLTNIIDYFGDFEGFVWDQGQEDAGRVYTGNPFNSAAATTYTANFTSYIAALRAYVGRTAAQLPVLIIGLGRLTPPGAAIGNYTLDPSYDLFRLTQYQLTQSIANCAMSHTQADLTLLDTTTNQVHLSGTVDMGYMEDLCRVGYAIAKITGLSTTDRRGALPLSAARTSTTIAVTFDANSATALTCAAALATNFSFWTDNTYTTPLTPSAMNIGALGGGQFVVTWTFAATAAGNVVTSGKGGAASTGGIFQDSANALKATQPDGRSVMTWPLFTPIVLP